MISGRGEGADIRAIAEMTSDQEKVKGRGHRVTCETRRNHFMPGSHSHAHSADWLRGDAPRFPE